MLQLTRWWTFMLYSGWICQIPWPFDRPHLGSPTQVSRYFFPLIFHHAYFCSVVFLCAQGLAFSQKLLFVITRNMKHLFSTPAVAIGTVLACWHEWKTCIPNAATVVKHSFPIPLPRAVHVLLRIKISLCLNLRTVDVMMQLIPSCICQITTIQNPNRGQFYRHRTRGIFVSAVQPEPSIKLVYGRIPWNWVTFAFCPERRSVP